MINKNAMTGDDEHCPPHLLKRICWSAIFTGAIVGIGLGFLLNLFAIAVGLSAFTLNQEGAVVLALGGMMGLLIGTIVSMGTAGFTAGYLGRFHCPERNLGVIYGFTTWSVALILSAMITVPMGTYMMAYSDAISQSVMMAGDESAETAPAAPPKSHHHPAKNPKPIKAPASANSLAWSAFSLFALFFIGALSSCFGGYWGMGCKRRRECV